MRLVALALLLAGCAGPPPPGGPVAMFRGGPRHPGTAPGPSPAVFAGLAWRIRTGGPVRSSPTVAGETVYVGSADGRLYALDRRTGETRWAFAVDGPVDSSPAVAGGRVFTVSRAGTLWALERATGRPLWKRETGPDLPLAWGHENGDYYTASPAVVGDTVVFGAGDGGIYAVAAGTGEVLWRHPTGGRVRSSPAVADGVVYAGSMDGSLYAVELATGRERWRYDTEGRGLDSGDFGFDRRTIQSSPAVVDGTVYVGSRDGHLYALDAASGALRWRFDHQISWAISSPAVTGGRVYEGSSDARFFHAVDAATGRELWRIETPSIVWSSPVAVGDAVVFCTGAGTVHVVDAATGAERWRWRAGGPVLSTPAVADGVVYVGDGGGWVQAIRATGDPLERAVFWDAGLAAASTNRRGEDLRDDLAGRGYRVLDATGLTEFLAARTADREPSVVVFAEDVAPEEVAATGADTVLLRRYLEAGGKVVWIGRPPLIWPLDPETGEVRYDRIDRGAPTAILGVDHERANFDSFRASPTPAGKRWGLAGWWPAAWSVDPAAAGTVLATDENGLAAAWARSYGGPPGTGWVRLPRGIVADGGEEGLAIVDAVAEYRPPAGR